MEQTIVETAPSTICERSDEHKAKKRKKRKSSAINADSSNQPDDVSLQKRSRSEGDLSSEDVKSNAVVPSLKTEASREERRKVKKSHFRGDLSVSHTSDASTQTNAEVSNLQSKENDKERKLAKEGKSKASQGGESDILNESCNIEIAPLASCNENMEHDDKKRKKSKKRNSSISNADSNCNPDQADAEVSQMPRKYINKAGNSHVDREAGDGIVSYDSNTASHNDCCALEDIKSNAAAPSLKTEVTLSTIGQEKGEDRRERKRQKRKNATLNASSDCNPEDNCLQDKSHSGGDLTLSHTNDASTQANVEVSNQQTKENRKDGKEREMSKKGNSHASQGGELDILNEACKIQTVPSVLSNQSMERNAKKRKKSKKRNSSISNADRNCNPDQADAEVSQLQRKESIKTESSHIDREAAVGIVTFDSNAGSHNSYRASEDGNSNIASQSCNTETGPSTICDQSKDHKTKKKKRKHSSKIDDSVSHAQSNCDPASSFREKPSFGGEAALDQSCVSLGVRLRSIVVKEPRPSNRKLLILDLNGLLADIIKRPSKHVYPDNKPHTKIGSNRVFTRPFCDEFLQFCFESFDVAVWSSRLRCNVELIVDCLFGDRKNQLLFCWDMSHCTSTGRRTPGKKHKPLVFKELKKVWEKGDPCRPWKVGDYDESNTLLIDDSPCKAVCNPPYTGIFPESYKHPNLRDKSLGPNGDLRLYLERLSTADNVQQFVAENPFGKKAITNKHRSWAFYSTIMDEIRARSAKCSQSANRFRNPNRSRWSS